MLTNPELTMVGLGKILVVDDVAQIRLQVRSNLEDLGYTVLTASSGQAALDILERDNSIDLVLLDVFMDDVDGFETLKRIRSQSKTELIKVIMLTGSNELEDVTRAFELGAQDYLAKPYRPLELKSRVETHLRLKQREEKLTQQEAILRQSEERFRMVSQLTTDFAYLVETDGKKSRWVWVFGDLERITGRAIDKFFLPQVYAYLHPDDRPVFDEFIKNINEDNKGLYEFRLKHKDGTYRWLRAQIFPLEKDEQAASRRYLGVVKDITDLKSAEADLASANRFMNKLFDTAPMRISVYDIEKNTIEYTNQPEEGYLPETTIEQYNRLSPQEKFTLFAHPDDKNVWYEILDKSSRLADETPSSVEFRRMGQDGRYHWLRTYMSAFDLNDEEFVNKLLMVNMDITEEKEAKLALQKAHDELETRVMERTIELEKANVELKREIEQRRVALAYLRATINNNLQAFVLLDPERKILTYNHVFETMVQRILSKDLEQENSVYDLLLPTTGLSFFESRFEQALSGKVIEEEFNLVSQGGVPNWYRICFTPSLSDENQVMGVCVAVLDVSKQKKAELGLEKERLLLQQRVLENTTKLQEANAELLRANHAKDEFLASMSHELRTPLNDIITSTDAMLNAIYGPFNDQQKRILAGVKESGLDLQMLITDILDVARAEVGKMNLDITQVRLDTIITTSIRLVQDQARQKNIDVQVSLDEKAIHLMADAMRLKQMLSNLLVNAIKFTPPGGKVGIEVKGDPAACKVNLTVWDTGPGIPAEFFPRMFKPFEQADPKGQHYTGSGLGLYLVQKMADMHGGGVSLQSEPGKGSRFTISLPWKEANTLQYASPERTEDRSADMPLFNTHPVILVAEDNEIALSVMSDALKSRGCQVLEARNGKEVLDQMEGPMVNLILMDIQMPEIDGIEAIRFLRSKGFTQTPIIALTAAALPGDRDRCLTAGANDYFSKPVDMKVLMRAIKARLD